MKKQKRFLVGLIICFGMLAACQKDSVDNSELLRIQSQNDSLRVLILQLQERSDSIYNALRSSQQQQAGMQIALDSLTRKMDSVLVSIEKINLELTQVGADLVKMKLQITLLTQQYQQILLLLGDLEEKSCTIYTGLLAYYPFSGNVLDSSGKRYDGTITNTIAFTTDRNNQPNSAILLNGGFGSRITATVPFNFQRTDDFSFSFWFTDGGNTANGRLISTENPEGNFRIGSYQNGRYSFSFGEYYVYDTVALNTWTHVVYTYSNRTIKLYKNGQLKVTHSDPGVAQIIYGTPFTIGAKAAPAYDTWNGKLDDLRIYKRVLTPAEVKWLFEE